MTNCESKLRTHYPVLEHYFDPTAGPVGEPPGDYWIEVQCQRMGGHEDSLSPEHVGPDGQLWTAPAPDEVAHRFRELAPSPTYVQSDPFRVRID